MEFLQELEKLQKSLFSFLTVFLFFTIFFFAFGPKGLLPTQHSFSVLFFQQIQKDLVPFEVELVALNPLSAFLAQVIVSLFLAFIASLPFFLYGFTKYFSPVFSQQEKKQILKILFPSFFLFIIGCLFAYFILIPTTLKILYGFPVVMGVIPFFVVNEFIFFVLGIMLISGIMFLLPIFMVLLSWVGIIKKDFWKNNWRYAVSTFLIFSAIITPDGSGITMLMLSVPLSSLYFLGYCLTAK